jgi:hypothetical protein
MEFGKPRTTKSLVFSYFKPEKRLPKQTTPTRVTVATERTNSAVLTLSNNCIIRVSSAFPISKVA